uniref:Glucose-methanol-choline oxidoreductase N-terminal domain-containing protein n=1 Tax=Bionectria ochroleuca TaxID=29856 RepID=A0A8H7TL61_BIOOC
MRSVSNFGLLALSLAGSALAAPSKQSYDYIVVGGGPAGIITADRLSETNKQVLLIERGPGPTIATGSNHSLVWNDTLTPIDVPGLTTAVGGLDIWNEYSCKDTAASAMCVLGGGATVNYMVFVHPPARDFDDKWPKGWKWKDIAPAANKFYERNPGSNTPSEDGQRYDQGMYDTFAPFFDGLGWKATDMSKEADEKHQVYSHPTWNIKNAMRAGPVRTYLPFSQARENFTLRLGTNVIRLVRKGSRVTGVEIQNSDGSREIVQLNRNGRVVLAAGAMSTPKVLFNSGIGPKEQIQTAKKTGVTLPDEKEWIELPVGKSFKDHNIFTLNIQTNETWGPLDSDIVLDGTDTKNIDLYESTGSGVLTQGRHRMVFFTSNVGSDGVTRYYQGSAAPSDTGLVSLKVYQTHGLTSEGVLGLAADGKTTVVQSPYLQTEGDREAATALVDSLVKDITSNKGFQIVGYTNTSAIINAATGGNHFVGTTKLGTDDGRKGGSSVVDTNAKVYGTDNLFITDASIHPDLPSGNSQAIVMVVAEAAVEKILAC